MWCLILLEILLALIACLFGCARYFFQFSMVRKPEERDEVSYFTDEDSIWQTSREDLLAAQKWMWQHNEGLVTITSHDGLQLAALSIPAETDTPKGTFIVFHGYRSLATVDFAPEVRYLHSLGYRLLVPYQRSHGKSEGKYITYGIKERFDCQQWAEYAAERWGGDIFLSGISMGSSTVMMAAGLPVPQNVRGIIADCGFTTPWEIMKQVAWRDYKLPAFPILHLVNLFARHYAGVDLKEADTREALRQTTIPLYLIHDMNDDFVPLSMSEENEAAYSKKTLMFSITEGNGHAQSFVSNPFHVMEGIRDFVDQYASKPEETPDEENEELKETELNGEGIDGQNT